MKVDTRILDLNALNKCNYATLLDTHKMLSEAKEMSLDCKEIEINNGNVLEAITIDTQLRFINMNLDRVEVAMTMKEDDAFELHQYKQICKN